MCIMFTIIAKIRISPVFQKQAKHVNVGTAFVAKDMNGVAYMPVTSVDVCTMRQEELGDLHEHFLNFRHLIYLR